MKFDDIKNLIPVAPDWIVKWDVWEDTPFHPYIEKMKSTPQNPEWHAEGDVWTHTKMVCEALIADEDFRKISRRKQEILFLAALMHDIGKPKCTVIENGVITSPYHTATGSKLARTFLWAECGLSGTAEAQSFREAICTLIRYHGTPPHLDGGKRSERTLIKIASFCELVPDFSLEMLQILVRSDMKGRIAKDTIRRLEDVEVVFMLADELGIMKQSYRFPDQATKHAYLSGRNVPRDYALYDDTWKEVILVSGLPGTGKDTWIAANYPDLPVISLDDIRRDMNISPTDKEKQGLVVAHARELAKELLRKNQSFVWNATNISAQLRGNQLALFEKYHAYTHIVFIETELAKELERNSKRDKEVPENIILDLLAKTEPPAEYEAHSVEWIIT